MNSIIVFKKLFEFPMLTAYVVVTVLAAAANIFSATLDFIRYKRILISMAKANVPESWLTMLGILKAAGALGLLVGISMPLIGTAAAIGLILFFVAAVITHLRARDYSFGLALLFLLLAVAALVVDLHVRGSAALALVRVLAGPHSATNQK